MNKSAKEVIQESMFSALVEALAALRRENVDNAVLREVKAIHSNSTFADLPDCVKRALRNSTDAALSKLSTEGYVVTSKP